MTRMQKQGESGDILVVYLIIPGSYGDRNCDFS